MEKEQLEIELSVAHADWVAVERLMTLVHKGVANESTVEALQRKADNASEEFLDVLDRYNIEKSKALITSPLQPAIRGLPNDRPEIPKRYLVIAITWMTSLMICIFIITVREITDTNIKSTERLKLKSGLRVAAVVGKINTKNLNLNDLFVLNQRKDLDGFKNHLRKLRYEIEESGGRVLLITSTSAKQGKTFLILCLSYMLALLKKKILIIDTNFRDNSITQALQRKAKDQRNASSETAVNVYEKSVAVTNEFPNAIVQSTLLTKDQVWIEAIGNSGSSMSPAEVFVGKDFKKYDRIIERTL
jgi:Mrp family chromosome partitioning ATPase